MEPIINKCKVVVRRLKRIPESSPAHRRRRNEPLFLHEKGDEIVVKGQIRRKRDAARNPVYAGDDPDYDFYIIFKPKDLAKKGLWNNEDESLDIKSGDFVTKYQISRSKYHDVDASVVHVRPESPDYFMGSNHLLIYVFCKNNEQGS